MSRLSFPKSVAKSDKKYIKKPCNKAGCDGDYRVIYLAVSCYLCGHSPHTKVKGDPKLARESKRGQKIAKDLIFLTDDAIDEILRSEK